MSGQPITAEFLHRPFGTAEDGTPLHDIRADFQGVAEDLVDPIINLIRAFLGAGQTADDAHEHFHYLARREAASGEAVALCSKVWVPTESGEGAMAERTPCPLCVAVLTWADHLGVVLTVPAAAATEPPEPVEAPE